MKLTVKNFVQIISIVAIAATGVGCSQANKEYTQIDLANKFVQKLNEEQGGGERYQVVKAVSNQQDYMVVLDRRDPADFFALQINDYSWGADAHNYLDQMNKTGQSFYNLRSNFDGTYTYVNPDGTDGPTFSATRTGINEKDLRKVQAAVQNAKVEDLSNKLVENYGMTNPDDATRAARALVAYSDTMSKREMTQADIDQVSKQIVGFTASEAVQAYKSGDQAKINELLKRANEKGIGSTPQEAKAIVAKVLSNI